MPTITIVTGNPHKLAELQKVFPASLSLTSRKLDLEEIQSLDLHSIVRHKLHQAFDQLQRPVIVDDVSAELEKFNGLPGPFVKFFLERLGPGGLYKLGGEGRVRIVCTMGYYDGYKEHIVDGVFEGQVVPLTEGEGFGFDFEIIPDGYEKTLAQLGVDIKNTISHRALAAKQLADYLTTK